MANELYHYGRKGMKWYQTIFSKGKNGSGKGSGDDESTEGVTAPKPKKSKPAPEHIPKKKLKDMSESEIKDRINRLKLEDDLRKLEKSVYPTRGKNFIMDVLESSGKNIATQFTTLALGTATNKILQELLGAMDPKYKGEQFVNPKKGQKDK